MKSLARAIGSGRLRITSSSGKCHASVLLTVLLNNKLIKQQTQQKFALHMEKCYLWRMSNCILTLKIRHAIEKDVKRLFFFIIAVVFNMMYFSLEIKASDITLNVEIINSLTGREVLFPNISIYRLINNSSDSVKIDADIKQKTDGIISEIEIPRENGSYMLKFEGINMKLASMLGEETFQKTKAQGDFAIAEQYFSINDSTPHSLEIPKIMAVRPMPIHKLKELQVTASKVMFYHKGDTLVYNADAFVLADGSMLDGLLQQLPGVELKANGEIKVNGKRVDRLLLNGKDLFNGQKQLMLENLAAYKVKKIAVYNKSGLASELMERNMNDFLYVMDVKLKREYSSGWSLNGNVGYGTHSRYAGKLFGMWHSENASLIGYANLNNLNCESLPGQTDVEIMPSQKSDGEWTRKEGGLNYLISGQGDVWELKGNLAFRNLANEVNQDVTKQYYLDGGDKFEYKWNSLRNKNVELDTRHTLTLKLKKLASITFTPTFIYRNINDKGSEMGVQLDEMYNDLNSELVESIYSNQELYALMINRKIGESHRKGNSINSAMNIDANFRLFRSSQMINVKLSGSVVRSTLKKFDKFNIDFKENTSDNIAKYQYVREKPENRSFGLVSLRYMPRLNKYWTAGVIYEFASSHTDHLFELYNLDTTAEDLQFGLVPSLIDVNPYIDTEQSFDSKYDEHRHTMQFNAAFNCSLASKQMSLSAEIPLNYYYRSFVYNRIDYPALHLRKSNFIQEFRFYAAINDQNFSFSGGFNSEIQLQDMLYMVEVTNTTDPLNIMLGNPRLNPARINAPYIVVVKSDGGNHTINQFLAHYRWIDNALARGYYYNPETGVMTSRMYNVNGNKSLDIEHTFRTYFGKRYNFIIEAKTHGQYQRSVDIAGSMDNFDTSIPPLRKVNGMTFGEYIDFNFKTGRHSFSVIAKTTVNRYWSKEINFNNFTSLTGGYGVKIVMNLPHDWGFSTDVTQYIRRGFLDPRLNTDDLVWNARISKSLLKGSLIVSIDGYDIFHQLSNVKHMINAQARTVTVTNAIPAYFMARISYSFNQAPQNHR